MKNRMIPIPGTSLYIYGQSHLEVGALLLVTQT